MFFSRQWPALLMRRVGFHPRAALHRWMTYPRFLGTIKPELLRASELEYEVRLRALAGGWWPAALECPVGRRLLALSPHPDDEAIGAGGLLLRHRGVADIHLLTVFSGEGGGALAGDPWHDATDYKRRLVAERQSELARTASVLGAVQVRQLGLPEGCAPPTIEMAQRLREHVDAVAPDVVLLPWFLDGLGDHRAANILYAWGCADIPCTVLAYEVWTLLQPNAFVDITDVLEEKLALIRHYETQNRTVDYVGYAAGLARTRAFLHPVRGNRSGAVEAYCALPNRDYCDLVRHFFGPPGALRPGALQAM